MNRNTVQSLLDKAQRYIEEGRLLHAGQMYRRLINADPALEEPYIRLSALYREAGHNEESGRILRQGVQLCRESTNCLLMLGDQLLESGDLRGALACFAPLAQKKLPHVHVRVARALIRLGKTADAELEVRKALSMETRLPQARELLGEILLVTGRPAEAANELRLALRLDPYSSRSHRLMGQVLLQNRNLEEALDAFLMAADIDPDDALAWQYRGETLMRLRRFPEAKSSLRRSLDLNPSSADASVLMGELCVQKGDMEQALTAFTTALRLHPGHQRAMDGRLHARMRTIRLIERVGLFLLALLQWCSVSTAQTFSPSDGEGGVLFNSGVSQYQSGQFKEAAETFGRIIAAHPGDQRITAAIIMKGKALYWLGDNLESARTARLLLTDFPRSRYVADARFILGSIYRRVGRAEDAMEELLKAWETMSRPEPPRLAMDIVTAVDTLAAESISPPRLRSFIETTSDRECKAFLWLKIAENEAAAENMVRSRLALDTLLLMYPAQVNHPRVAALLKRTAERSDVKLGVLLPLMRGGEPSAAKEIAQEVLEGVTFAVEQFMAESGQRVRVTQVTLDSERDPVVASSAVRELAADKQVVAIVGPIFSSSTVAAARIAEDLGIPLVSPTANANGIAAVGPHVFQANPDYRTRGRAMAQYAVLRRGFTRLAVLAPSDTYGRFLAEAFGEEVRRLGARLIAAEWYERGSSDLKKQLGAIRRAGMRAGADPLIAFGGKKKLGELMKLAGLGVSVRTLDSLMQKGATVNATTLIGPDAGARLDSLGISVVYEELYVDSLDHPVTAIDGLYMPISSPAEIGIVASQAVYFNFRTQMLGSGEWNNLPELDANRRYCTGVVFEADSHVDTLTAQYRNWLAGFYNRFKKQPTHHTFYGYDTAEILLLTLGEGATTRRGFIRAFAEVRDYQGLHSKIGFSRGRVNTWLPILQFDGRNVLRIDEIRTE